MIKLISMENDTSADAVYTVQVDGVYAGVILSWPGEYTSNTEDGGVIFHKKLALAIASFEDFLISPETLKRAYNSLTYCAMYVEGAFDPCDEAAREIFPFIDGVKTPEAVYETHRLEGLYRAR